LSLSALRDVAEMCQACEPYRDATQSVMGDGPRHASLMLAFDGLVSDLAVAREQLD
jgi:uracil-DNA glycosylase